MRRPSIKTLLLLPVVGAAAAASLTIALAPVLASPAILSLGEVEIGIGYAGSGWDLHIHDEGTNTEYEPDAAILRVLANAATSVPNDPAYAFLGNPGDAVWILPQVQDPNLLYLGYSAGEIAPGVFTGDQVLLRLLSVSGEGHFIVYLTDSFGAPQQILFSSRDGIDAADAVAVNAGDHVHANWAFTAPGIYKIGFEASGTLAAGNQFTSSGEVVYTFEVMEGGTAIAVGGVAGLLDSGPPAPGSAIPGKGQGHASFAAALAGALTLVLAAAFVIRRRIAQ
jgi:surface-anchored protein